MSRIVALLLMLFMASAQPAAADEADSRALAEELLMLMDIESNLEQSFAGARKMQMAQLRELGRDAEDAEEVEAMIQRMMDVTAEELSWTRMKDEYIRIYTDTFSAEEIQGLIDFYKSPIGQNFIAKTPELTRRSMELSQKMMNSLTPKLRQLTQEMLEAMEEEEGLE